MTIAEAIERVGAAELIVTGLLHYKDEDGNRITMRHAEMEPSSKKVLEKYFESRAEEALKGLGHDELPKSQFQLYALTEQAYKMGLLKALCIFNFRVEMLTSDVGEWLSSDAAKFPFSLEELLDRHSAKPDEGQADA